MLGTSDQMLTVDELAARAGVTVRTVRFYAGKGMLPPPVLRGRVGLYGPTHLARLDLIRELQELGFTLAAIERYLERLGPDATIEDIALHGALVAPWAPEEFEELDFDALDRRAGRHLDEEAVRRLVALGALERVESGRVRVVGPTQFSLALELLDLKIPFELLVTAGDVINQHADAMARDLQRLFADKVLRPYREHGAPAEERAEMLAALRKLRPVTTKAVVTAFQHAVNRAIRGAVDKSTDKSTDTPGEKSA